jgi:hypothetical protein
MHSTVVQRHLEYKLEEKHAKKLKEGIDYYHKVHTSKTIFREMEPNSVPK